MKDDKKTNVVSLKVSNTGKETTPEDMRKRVNAMFEDSMDIMTDAIVIGYTEDGMKRMACTMTDEARVYMMLCRTAEEILWGDYLEEDLDE